MTPRASIAALLQEMDRQSPAGFAIALHIRFTTPTYLFQSYPGRWLEYYSAEGLVLYDPTVHWGLQNFGHIRWGDLEPIDSRGVLKKAKDFGLMNGVAIAVMQSGTRTIGSFARADRDYHDEEMQDLESLLSQLHATTVGASELSQADKRALTELSIRLTH